MSPMLSVTVVALALLLGGCGTEEVWSCQNSGTSGGFDGTSVVCNNQWLCETRDEFSAMVLEIKCAGAGETFTCQCLGNGQSGTTFTTGKIQCGADLTAEANRGCGWGLPEE